MVVEIGSLTNVVKFVTENKINVDLRKLWLF